MTKMGAQFGKWGPGRRADRPNATRQLAAGDFLLYVRSYWPKAEIMEGSWTPPAVQRVG